jgi:hypothetical protein
MDCSSPLALLNRSADPTHPLSTQFGPLNLKTTVDTGNSPFKVEHSRRTSAPNFAISVLLILHRLL